MQDADLQVAVIGLEGRFPEAPSPERLWELSVHGASAIAVHDPEAMLLDGVPEYELRRPHYVPAKGVIEDALRFDAQRFGFSPAEAVVLDPQQRVFLECCASALDRGGCDPKRFKGAIGVFAGQFLSTYWLRAERKALIDQFGLASVFQGNTVDQLATRAAYKLDLTGPSLTVQTACSTSLVAVHLACQSLLRRECDAALAGGVMLTFPSRAGYVYIEGGIWSRSGVCRPFDGRADGTVFSDGAGVVLLKRLADALAAGDPIRAVIIGSAINNDGADKAGHSAPSLTGQVRVLAEALEMSGAPPSSVGYIETHGTGTALGDPLEIEALNAVYGGQNAGPILLGALKGNIGHLDAAAGVASLIRACMALETGVAPPMAGFQDANPLLRLDATPFRIPRTVEPWPSAALPRRAAVSAFGVGGANAHVILESAPARPSRPGRPGMRLTPLSSHSSATLETLKADLAEALAAEPRDLASIQRTLALGREQHGWRECHLVASTGELVAAIKDGRSGPVRAPSRQVVFLFPGQGALVRPMDREFFSADAAFREPFQAAAEALRGAGAENPCRLFDADETQLSETQVAQPVAFALGYALARWLEFHGLRPDAVIGHSVGEFAAAVAAGALSLEQAARLVAGRGRLMQRAARGAMLGVQLPADELATLMGPELDLAADNAPRASAAAGPITDVEALEARLAARGVGFSRFSTSHAFHSRAMDPVLDDYGELLSREALGEPSIPYYSTLLGRQARDGELSAAGYWSRQLREPVRFRQAVDEACLRPTLFLELSPTRQLSTLAAMTVEGQGDHVAMPVLEVAAGRTTHDAALGGLGRAWSNGATLDWERLSDEGDRVELPPNPLTGQEFDLPRGPPPEPAAAVDERPGSAALLSRAVYQSEPPRTGASRLAQARRRWLLVSDEQPLLDRFADFLEARGQVVSAVSAAGQVLRLARGRYLAPLETQEGMTELLRQLRAHVRTPSVILQLVQQAGGSDRACARRLGPLMAVAQALHAEGGANRVRYILLTERGLRVLAADDVAAPIAEVMGAAAVVPQECSAISTRVIDVQSIAKLSDHAMEEVLERAIEEADHTVAFRSGTFFRRRFEAAPPPSGGAHIRKGGLYIITGGLGAIGLALAERWARDHGARVVLLSRRDLKQDVAAERRLRMVLEQAEGAVVALRADVLERQTLATAIQEARTRFGPLKGVVHAAGLPGGRISLRDTLESALAVMAPKTHGLVNLERVLAGLGLNDGELEFVLLCSSVAAIVGGPGQWSYAAANAHLDSFAESRRAGEVAWISLNLDTIADEGMAAGGELHPSLRAARDAFGFRPLSMAEAVAGIEHAIQFRSPRVVLSRFDCARADEVRAALAGVGRTMMDRRQPRPDLATAYAPPRTEAERLIAEIWAEGLGVEKVGIHDSFTDLGGHSLIAAEMAGKLRQRLDLNLPISALFEFQTVAGLSDEVERLILAELGADPVAGAPEAVT